MNYCQDCMDYTFNPYENRFFCLKGKMRLSGVDCQFFIHKDLQNSVDKTKTNRDWIDSLSDEQFADWCAGIDTYKMGEGGKVECVGLHPHRRNIEEQYNSSYGGILDWLKQERKSDEL